MTLPSRKEVRDLLEVRLGREITFSPAELYAPSPYESATFGVYVDQHLRVRALAFLDLELATLAGGAMAQVPVGLARSEQQSRALVAETRTHLQDLLAELTPLLSVAAGVAVRHYDTYLASAGLPADIPAYVHRVGSRMDLRVGVAGYGSGRLSLVCPPVVPRPRRPERSAESVWVR
jgi:hypothetical protein